MSKKSKVKIEEHGVRGEYVATVKARSPYKGDRISIHPWDRGSDDRLVYIEAFEGKHSSTTIIVNLDDFLEAIAGLPLLNPVKSETAPRVPTELREFDAKTGKLVVYKEFRDIKFDDVIAVYP